MKGKFSSLCNRENDKIFMSKFYLNVDSVFVMPICFSICKQQNLKKKIDDKQKMTKEYLPIYEQKTISKEYVQQKYKSFLYVQVKQ